MALIRTIPFLAAVALAFAPGGPARAQEDSAMPVRIPGPEAVLRTLKPGHPRLLADAARFEQIKQAVKTDPLMKEWFAHVRTEATRLALSGWMWAEGIGCEGTVAGIGRGSKRGSRGWSAGLSTCQQCIARLGREFEVHRWRPPLSRRIRQCLPVRTTCRRKRKRR